MKPLSRSLVILGAAALLLTTRAVAQRKPAPTEDEGQRARGLYVNKKSDAMSVTILKLEGGALVPVAPSHEFKKGDQIKVEFQSNFDGLIYFVNISPSGKRCILFPQGDASTNSVRADQRYTIPPGGDMIQFDEEKGTEILQVIMSKDRIPTFDAAIKERADACLGQTASSAAEELQGGITGNVTPAVPAEDTGKVRSRDIILSAGKTRDKQGSVVAIPDKDGTGGRLKTGEIAPFEIRLKHN
jgi:hypothetical protein